jgi:hypothetical protein
MPGPGEGIAPTKLAAGSIDVLSTSSGPSSGFRPVVPDARNSTAGNREAGDSVVRVRSDMAALGAVVRVGLPWRFVDDRKSAFERAQHQGDVGTWRGIEKRSVRPCRDLRPYGVKIGYEWERGRYRQIDNRLLAVVRTLLGVRAEQLSSQRPDR